MSDPRVPAPTGYGVAPPAPAPVQESGTDVWYIVHISAAWLLTVGTLGYFLPWAIAASRRKSNTLPIALVDLLLGWTLVGWIVALVMACGAEQRPVAAAQIVQVNLQQTYAPGYQQPLPPMYQTQLPPTAPKASAPDGDLDTLR